MFELALAMADVETAVALCEAAALDGSDLKLAQARVWAAEVALGVPTRLLKLFAGAGLYDTAKIAALTETADLPSVIAAQAGVVADMNLIARKITE